MHCIIKTQRQNKSSMQNVGFSTFGVPYRISGTAVTEFFIRSGTGGAENPAGSSKSAKPPFCILLTRPTVHIQTAPMTDRRGYHKASTLGPILYCMNSESSSIVLNRGSIYIVRGPPLAWQCSTQ